MSTTLLETLDDLRAFEPTRRFEDLGDFHVPFDRLTGSSQTEAALRGMAEHQGKVALIGPSGAGKSSVIAAVLGPLAEELPPRLVPIRIPVAAASAETVTSPGAFAQHLLQVVIRYSSELLTVEERRALEGASADQLARTGPERSHRISAGAPQLIVDVGLASEVRSGAEQSVVEVSAGRVLEAMARFLEVFRAHDREPFWIIDDSDRWLRVGGEDQPAIADEFFRRIVSMLAREVDCGFVIAVHDEYLGLGGYREAKPLLSRMITLPLPEDAVAALTSILDHRLTLFEAEAGCDDLFDRAALELLAARYRDDRNLRNVLALVNRATQLACTDRAEVIGPDLVRTAQADLA